MDRSVKLGKRALSKAEALTISEEIALTPNIIGYLPRELLQLNDVLVIENKTEIMGILAYVETGKFVDLKIFIIREKFRGKGYGAKMFNDFIGRFGGTKKPIYTVTKNPAVIHLLKRAGFVNVRFVRLPVSYILHEAKKIFSLYRTREFLRKSIKFPHGDKFSYWVRV